MGGLVILFFKPNTTPFQGLDNSSTLAISGLFLALSSFYPIDLKYGLKLSSLLPLCSFSLPIAVVGEDYIFACVLMCSYSQVLLLFWGPKHFYVKNVIFSKDFTEF